MNLAAIVQGALNSLPAGIRTRVDITRTVPGTVDRDSGARSGDTTLVMRSVPVTIIPARADRTLPPGLKREHAREVIIAGADCPTFVPNTDDVLQLGASSTTVIESDVVDLGNADAPIVVTLLVKW